MTSHVLLLIWVGLEAHVIMSFSSYPAWEAAPLRLQAVPVPLKWAPPPVFLIPPALCSPMSICSHSADLYLALLLNQAQGRAHTFLVNIVFRAQLTLVGCQRSAFSVTQLMNRSNEFGCPAPLSMPLRVLRLRQGSTDAGGGFTSPRRHWSVRRLCPLGLHFSSLKRAGEGNGPNAWGAQPTK